MGHDFNSYPELTNRQMDVYYFESPHKQITEDFTAKVVKVHDGDTITVETNFRDFTFPIRMAKIAAPELNEGGHQSQKWLEAQILGKEIEIQINPFNRVGKYGRLIGTIIYGGMNINELSIDMGESVPFENATSEIPNFNKELGAVF